MNLEEKRISDISGSFVIEAYQRGYRWGKDEVEHLLNDIVESSHKYCLQPIVVKDLGNDVYELIDGQQRLTTLYLIMKFLKCQNQKIDLKYSIEYKTRDKSKELLEAIDEKYKDLIPSNIDALFIKEAYQIITDWFDHRNKMETFVDKLVENVTIIWYEVNKDEDSVAIFTRLNIGKINLTNAELVKALFLNRGRKDANGHYSGNIYGIEEKKQHEIALVWDTMEKELHNEKFWAFITNEPSAKYPIRMELLFNLIAQKPIDSGDYYTFNYFCEKFKNNNERDKIWEEIERNMQKLKEWYSDFDLYHHVGFLVASGENVKDLLYIANTQDKEKKRELKKSEFRNELLEKIRERMKFTTGDGKCIDYEDLNYEEHPKQISEILLLFNVETIRQKKDKGNRFPFDRYKDQGKWSLEHIHAQNSESLQKADDWKSWLVQHRDSLIEINKYEKDPDKREKIEDVLKKVETSITRIVDENFKGSKRAEFDAVYADVRDLLSDGDDRSQTHTLSNMALLTTQENAALSNSTFDVKRKRIIEMDKNGDYIPPCTKNVFLKYYSIVETDLHFWSEKDREAYIKAINSVLYGDDNNKIKLIKSTIKYGNKQ